MSENPDNKYYVDLGPQSKQKDSEGNEINMDARYMIPVQHQLRFIKRDDSAILQQYQWCQDKGAFDWYDIPLVEA